MVVMFDVAQSAIDGTISMMVIISSTGTDELFISLNSSNQDSSCISNPVWTHMSFNTPAETLHVMRIRDALSVEVSNQQQYLIVDLDRSESVNSPAISRYYVSPTKSSGRYWTKQDVPVDIEANDYESCVGRVKGGFVDGICTLGFADGVSQLVYQPVTNVFGDGPG